MVTAKQSNGMCAELFGLSSDPKPDDVGNASTFYEMDTAVLFIFDAENSTWYEVS